MKPYTKEKILDSIEALDEAQEMQVLDFINGILSPNKGDRGYESFKQHALQEIRQALSNKDSKY